jgi:hypothetical protein
MIICCLTCFFYSTLICEVHRSYERKFSISVIRKLYKLRDDQRSIQLNEALHSLDRSTNIREDFLPGLIRMNKELERMANQNNEPSSAAGDVR